MNWLVVDMMFTELLHGTFFHENAKLRNDLFRILMEVFIDETEGVNVLRIIRLNMKDLI